MTHALAPSARSGAVRPEPRRPAGARPIPALLVLCALVAVFGFIAFEVSRGATLAFDRSVLLFFRHPDDPAIPIGPAWVQEMARDVTSLGSYAVLGIVLLAVVGYLVLMRKGASALLVLTSVLGGVLLSNVLKLEFERPRPDVVPHAARVFTASFPSGHALLSAVTYLTLGALLARTQSSRRVKLYFVALATALTALIGTSRIYLGVHYPTDVLAGWTVGAAWAFACWAVAANLQRAGAVEPPDTAAQGSVRADAQQADRARAGSGF